MLFPIVTFDSISIADGNELLHMWGHKMGPLRRPMGIAMAHALTHNADPVAVVMTADLVRESVGGVDYLNRHNTIELARVCAAGRDWNRVAVRLWRLTVFPAFNREFAVSYQDADIHSGDLYRFDGWKKVGFSHSGVDKRSGRKGRNKNIWMYPPPRNAHQASTGRCL